MNRSSFLAAFVGILISLSTVADAGVNEFEGTFGTDWNDNRNWSTNAVPDYDDDVLIPTGLTCIISTYPAEAGSVEVEAGATLGIESETLYIDSAGELTVDGTV